MAAATVSPGTTFPTITLSTGLTGNLSIPALQDITINNANDVYSWTQLNVGAKLQVATTSTNSISTNMVVENATFFGDGAGTEPADIGIFGLSKAKTLCSFTITNVGSKTLSGQCYVTGLAPKVSADQPVWVTPCTLTVTGDFTVA